MKKLENKQFRIIPKLSVWMLLLGIGLVPFVSCDILTPGLGQKVDVTPPTLAIDALTSDKSLPYRKGLISLTGTVADDRAIGGLNLQFTAADGSLATIVASLSGATWSAAIPSGLSASDPSYSQSLADGERVVTFIATDKSGKASTSTYSIFVDNVKPTTIVSMPVIYGGATAGNSPTAFQVLDIKGEVWDPSPIVKVHVRILDNFGNVKEEQDADGTNTWAVRFNLTAAVPPLADQTRYYYDVSATDKAGNISTVYYHRSDIYKILPAGQVLPAVDEIGKLDQKGNASSVSASGITYTNLIGTRLGLSEGPPNKADFKYSSLAGPTVQWMNLATDQTTSTPLGVGIHIVGAILPPADGSPIVPSTIKFEIYTTNNPVTLLGTFQQGSADLILSMVGSSCNFDLAVHNGSGVQLPPGANYMVKLVASSANASLPPLQDVRLFTVDAGIPTITEDTMAALAVPPVSGSNPSASVHLTTANYSLNGSASSSSGVLSVSYSKDGSADTPVTMISATNWKIDESAVTDGTHTYVITVTSAGKSASVTRSVNVDSHPPVLSVTNLNNVIVPAGQSWLSGSSFTIRGLADDGSGRGTKEVWYIVDAAAIDHSTDTYSTWTKASGTTSWSATLNPAGMAEGNWKLWVKALDNAGNITGNAAVFTLDCGIDLAAPALTETTIGSPAAGRNAAFHLGGSLSDSNPASLANTTLTISGTRKLSTAPSPTAITPILTGTSWDYNEAALPADGIYTYIFTVNDVAGNTTQVTRVITVDTTGPVLAVGSPIAGQLVGSTSVTASGTASDALSGVASVSVSSDNVTWITASGTSNWIANLVYGEGIAKTLYVKAVDLAGNVSNLNLSFKVDNASPNLTETTNGPTIKTYKAGFSFDGLASDSNAMALANPLLVSVDGGAQTPLTLSAGAWTMPITVDTVGHSNDGSHTYDFTATDIVGRTTLVNRKVTIDTTAPSLTITGPGTGLWVSSASTLIKGVADDGLGSGVSKVYVLVDNAATDHSADIYSSWNLATGTYSWNYTASLVGEGQKKVWVKAVDAAGNVSSSAITLLFGYDAAPPVLTETSNGPTTKTYNASFVLGGAASDSNQLTGVTVSVNGGAAAAATLGAGTWSRTISVDAVGHTTDGTFSYSIVATDIAGNTTTVTRSAIVDTKAPTISVISPDPAGTSWVAGAGYTVKGVADDGGGVGVDKVYFITDAAAVDHSADVYTTWTLATGTSSWNSSIAPSGMAEGTKKLWVKAVDLAGNVTTSATIVNFGVDLAPPAFSESTIGVPAAGRSSTFNLGGSVSDSNPASILGTTLMVTGTVSVNAGAPATIVPTTGGGTWSYNQAVTGSNDGVYAYVFKATDVAGTSITVNRSITIDTTAPTLTITSPTAGQLLGTTSISASGTAADGLSGVASVQVSIDNSTWTAAVGTTNWLATVNYTEGPSRNLYVKATDGAGNVSTTTIVNFKVDINPPSLTETLIGPAATIRQSAFNFGGTAADSSALATAHSLTVSVNGGAATDITVTAGNWTYGVPVDMVGHTNDGNNSYVFTTTDIVGKTTTLTRTAVIDTLAPAITITSPAANQWLASATPTITGVATDGTGSGVNKVYVLVDNLAMDHSGDLYTGWPLATGTSSWSVNASLSGEGQKKVWVKSVDNAGNVTSSATLVGFGYDAAPPVLTETINGATTQSYSTGFNLGGVASDSDALVSVMVSLNGGSAVAATIGAGTWTYAVPVDLAGHTTDGNLAILITATDVAGKTTTVNRSAIVDTKAPTLVMINPDPAGTAWLSGNSYLIKGSADDGIGTGVSQVWIKVDAAAVDHSADAYSSWTLASGTSSFSTTINPAGLGDGAKKIWVKAVDNLGNATTTATTVLFGVDTVNPVLAFTTPANGASFNQAFTIGGTAVDSNLASISYTLDGGTANALGTASPWSIPLSGPAVAALTEGLHTVVLTVADSAGNTTSNTITFQKDSIVPVAGVNSLAAATGYTSTVVQDSTPVLNGTLTDNIALAGWNYRLERWTDSANLAGATWTAGSTMTVVKDWNGTAYPAIGASQAWSVDLNAILGGSLGLPLPDGRYRMLVSAVDGSLPANTSVTTTREFRLDRGIPALVVTSPASQGLYFGTDISMTGTSGEPNGIQAVAIKYDSSDFSSGTIYPATLGGTPTAATWSVTAPTAAVANGSHLVWVQSTAYSGKTSLASVSVNIDKTAPTVAISSTANAARVTGQLVVAGTANDNTVLSKVQYRFGLNASTWYDMPNGALYSWSYTFPDVSAYANATYAREINPTTKADQPGSNIWLMPFEVRAIDQAGNVANVTTATTESANRFYFMLDPLGDLPVSNIFSPSDGASLGGEINIYGNATDNTWVRSLSYQVSQDGSTWTDGVSAGSAGGSSSVATIVGNPGPTLSWSAKINSNGWMSPVSGTKTIWFRIHATDSKDFGATAGVNGTDTQISIVLNSSIPQIKNVQIDPDATPANGNEIAYSSGVKAAGVFYVRAEVYSPVGLADLKRIEQGPLTGQTSILADSSVVSLPSLKTAGSFVTGRKYLIQTLGTDYTLCGGVNTIGKTFIATNAGSGTGTAYEAESSGLYSGFFKYLVGMQIDSNTIGSNQFANTSGIYAFNLQAVDLTTPAPFQTSAPVAVQIDNFFPLSNGMSSVSNITGTGFVVQGQVTDVGAGSGTVAGIAKVVAYLTRGSTVLNLNGGAGSAGTTLSAKASGVGSLTSFIYPPTESGHQSYSFNVSSYSETPGGDDDTANGGNADGFEDRLTYNGSAVDWYAKFNSTLIIDGPAVLHFMVIDSAGNASHYTQAVFIANNPPLIVQITLGTDLNGDGTVGNVASGESVVYSPAQFAATSFTVRGSHMTLDILASGGNGTKFYSVKYGAAEQNAGLTSSVSITNFGGISDSSVANDRTLSVFVYDSTAGTTPGVDSLSQTKTISFTIKNVDSALPTVTMTPLYWNSASDNSLYANALANGHIDFGTLAAPLNDTNPKVSGQIKFNGTLSDDQRIQYVTMTIGNGTTGYDFAGGTAYGTSFVVAQWNGVSKTLVGVDNWASRGWKFVISNEALNPTGHSANWELDWDTAKLNTITGTNIAVSIKAQDFRNPGVPGGANLSGVSSRTIDVVPYISSISNPAGQGLTSDVLRSSTGKYSIDVNAATLFNVTGFNLGSAGYLPTAYVSAAAISAPSGQSHAVTFGTSSAIQVAKTTGTLRSGWFTVFVNGVPSTNNLNDNGATGGGTLWNHEYNLAKPYSSQWTDDRYLWLWSTTSLNGAAFNTQTYYYPDMYVTAAGQPIFTYDNDNNGYNYVTTSDTATSKLLGRWYERQGAIAFDGTSQYILSTEDAFGGGIGSLMLNIGATAGNAAIDNNTAAPTGAGQTLLMSEDNTSRQLNRFMYPKVLVDATGPVTTANGTEIYLAVNDRHPSNNNIRLWTMAKNLAGLTQSNWAVSGSISNSTMVVPGTAGVASPYFAITKIGASNSASHKLFVAWYNQSTSALTLSWTVNPVNANGTLNTGTTWNSTTIEAAGNFCGTEVSMTNDGTNLYISYYDSANADLKIAKVSGVNFDVVQTNLIDSYLSVGTWTSIQMYNGVPYIAYYSPSYNGTIKPLRLAFPTNGVGGVNAANSSTDGANAADDSYTGNWEIMTIPAKTAPKGGMEQFNHVNLGTYASNSQTLPVIGYVATNLEYGKLSPNN